MAQQYKDQIPAHSPLGRPTRLYANLDVYPAVWVLFKRYLVVLNAYMAQRQQARTTLAGLLGAVLTQFILQHEAHINEEYARIETERLRSKLGRVDPAAADFLDQSKG